MLCKYSKHQLLRTTMVPDLSVVLRWNTFWTRN